MEFSIDLRFLFILLINLVLLLLGRRPILPSSYFLPVQDRYPGWKFASLLIVTFLSLVFLLTSTELHLTAPPKITVKIGHFSGALALLMLASIFLPPPLFWLAYFLNIITFPWHGIVWDSLRFFFNRFVLRLKSFPPLVISCVQEQGDNPEAAQPPGFSVESVDIEVRGDPMQNLHSLE